MLGQGSVFLFRRENLPPPGAELVDVARRRWRIRSGDALLLTRGKGLDLMFLALVPVLEATWTRREGERDTDVLYQTTVSLGDAALLPEGLTLERVMFSLTRVSNFSRPWLHMRHKAKISPFDIETLVAGRIVWDRSVFFGLLKQLPEQWRVALETASRARSAYDNAARTGLGAAIEPVEPLLGLIRDLLIVPAEFAAGLGASWRQALDEGLETTEVVIDDGERDSWSLHRFAGTAERVIGSVKRNWDTINQLPYTESTARKEVQWRPHRW